MERSLVCTLEIHAFDDVNLTAVGPVGPYHPEGRPDSAGGTGHVCEIDGDKTVRVGLVGCKANGVAAAAGGDI